MAWWWLSFADGEQFLGVAVIRAGSFPEAIRVAHILGCNPGGEVHGEVLERDTIPSGYAERLLTRAEVEAMTDGNCQSLAEREHGQ